MAENIKLTPPTKLDAGGFAGFVRQLNLRLEQLVKQFEQRDNTPTLKTHLDAGNHRLTKVGRALSVDDALPLGQLSEALAALETDDGTSEGEDTTTNNRTSRRRRETEDIAQQTVEDAAPDAAPPPVATTSAIGTTTDPIQFALEDHTHAGYAAVRVNSGGSEITRRRLNVIAGTGVTVALVDDGGSDEADLTINATASSTGGFAHTFLLMGA